MAVFVSVYCIGCGDNLSHKSSKDRRNLRSDSIGDPAPREEALSEWISLLNSKLQLRGLSIDDINIDTENPGKMCRQCFNDFRRYHSLKMKLDAGNLHCHAKQWSMIWNNCPWMHQLQLKVLLFCKQVLHGIKEVEHILSHLLFHVLIHQQLR